MLKPLCLIVDDEPDLLELSARTLNNMDCKTASNLAQAKEWFQQNTFDFCLTDMLLPDGNGIELVAYIVQHYPDTPVAMITAYGNVETAVQALKTGAFDFISKPVNVPQLRSLAETALRLSKIYQRNKLVQSEPDSAKPAPNLLSNLVGRSTVMQELRSQVKKIALSQAPVCIKGESGSGKEVVARLIHDLGPRADMPFIPVNCGAIPTELMEREFFGHKKGSFTGAVTNEPGLFQVAEGGTLFLDEIAELPLLMQVKLLRAIQEKQIRAIGATTEIPVNVRILSATHRDLVDLVKSGQFRQDLFYRINVIEVYVPPLRERKEDIRDLVDHILTRLNSSTGGIFKPGNYTDAFIQRLEKYHFPGNVRELENIIERAMILCEGNKLDSTDLQLSNNLQETPAPKIPEPETPAPEILEPETPTPETPAPEILEPETPTPEIPAPEVLENEAAASQALSHASVTNPFLLETVEEQTIKEALKQTNGNKTRAAKLLGISFSALRYRLRRLDEKKSRSG
jgi:two-component system response regulator PilR (NtrC family)